MQKAAPFSFHCRICYERLNLTDRPPVVLPCGHTYICQQCSQRLTRCMECRTRIFPAKAPAVTPIVSAKAAAAHQESLYPRESYRAKQQRLYRQQQQQKYNMPGGPKGKDEVLAGLTPEPPAPLLPKNVVLMSLMEAAQHKHGVITNDDDDDAGYESGDDDAQVVDGLQALGSSCGTYVVKAKGGVWIYDGKPPPTTTATTTSNSLSSTSVTASSTATTGSNTSTPGNHNSILRVNSTSSADPPGKSPTKENDPPTTASSHHHSSSFRSLQDLKRNRSNNRRSSSNSQIGHDRNKSLGHAGLDGSTRSSNSSSHNQHKHASLRKKLFASVTAREQLEFGDTVQVVCLVDHNTVAQLARGQGFIRIVNHSHGSPGSDTTSSAKDDGQEEALVKGTWLLSCV